MLSRYTIYRGKRPASDPLPHGIRQDTRKHTRHILRPEPGMVEQFLDRESGYAWRDFRRDYLDLLAQRYAEDPEAFNELARLAEREDVFLGCSCPTRKNPDVRHCHTVVALEFVKKCFRELKVLVPEG